MFRGNSAVDVTDEGPSALTSGKIAGMADDPHTIDRWDDASARAAHLVQRMITSAAWTTVRKSKRILSQNMRLE
jgi:hypothetical protein